LLGVSAAYDRIGLEPLALGGTCQKPTDKVPLHEKEDHHDWERHDYTSRKDIPQRQC